MLRRPSRLHPIRPTLRLRLILWILLLLGTCGLLLLLFVNVGTVLSIRTGVIVTQCGPVPTPGEPPSHGALLQCRSRSEAPLKPWLTENMRALFILQHMRRESLLAVLGLLLGGAAGTYWLSGRALRPVRRVSEAAQHISLESLDVRLAVDGPDDELKRLADAFDAMLDRLRAGVERERLFLSAASHELRTPLAIVRTNLEVALANPDSTVDSYRRMAERAERSLSRLERVAEDLLTLARADVSLESEEVDIAGVVQEVAAELRPVAEENGIVLETEAAEGLQVRGEPALLYRALSNLVENGIRYNRSGGVVRVRAHQDREQVTLVVEDTGVGIPFDDQPSVFEPFFRVDRSRQRHRGGAGLGLALVREIVLWHGGTLTLKSSPGGGSMFTTRLPSAPTPR